MNNVNNCRLLLKDFLHPIVQSNEKSDGKLLTGCLVDQCLNK